MERKDQDELLKRLLSEKRKEILSIPGVIDFGIGYKMKRGRLTKQLGITIVVSRKLKKVPKKNRIPKKILGYDVDVIERKGEHLASHTDPNTQAPELVGGLSICNHQLGKYGTMGAVVFNNTDNAPRGLSNFHVLYGDIGQTGDPVVQPHDLATARVGSLADGDANLDCAVFEITDRPINNLQSQNDIDGLIVGIEEPFVDMRVMKAGAVTNVTHGIITHRFSSQITIRIDKDKHGPNASLAKQGDSGSVYVTVVNGQLFAVALQSKGERDSQGRIRRCYAKTMSKVAAEMDFHFK